TPYRDILYTNIMPSDEESRHIRELVVVPMRDIQRLTNEIAGFQARIDQLTQQLDDVIHERDGLNEFVESHLALVSTARRLPHDILRNIFTFCLPSERHPTLNRREAPVLISHICGDWRSLVLSMPRLWTSLHISAPSNN
ncbi:hypothetical protein B0H13DRAFT_1484434, partial [Mycena leptocephala]